VDTLHRYGCGYAAPEQWPQDGAKKNGRPIHRSKRGRIVTPHTTPSGRLVNLYGRAAGDGPDWLKHRHLKGTKALFNGRAIRDGSGPLVICEASLDALSFIEAGHARTVAVHGKTGLPWGAMRGTVRTIVFALDEDAQGEASAQAREAVLRGYEAHVLTPAEAYGDASDPNEALQAGTLDLSYLDGLTATEPKTEGKATEAERPDRESAELDDRKNGPDHESGSEWPVAERVEAHTTDTTRCVPSEPDALIDHWNGSPIGYLGRWLWLRGEAPMGRVDDSLFADAALHRYIVAQLERGPERAQRPDRLAGVLWRLYAAFGPEGPGPPPEPGTAVQAPFPAPYGREGTVQESRWDMRRKTWRVAVRPDDGPPHATQYFNRGDVTPALSLVTSQT
jgi:hypothetical protein